MPKLPFRRLSLITGLILFSAHVIAASVTAKTTITANIVPMSSLGLSNIEVPDRKLSTDLRQTETKANGVIIRTNLSNTRNSAKLKIDTYHNSGVAYDISVSPYTPLSTTTSDKIKTSRLHNDTGSINNTSQQAFEVEVRLNDTADKETERYSGAVEITVNYN